MVFWDPPPGAHIIPIRVGRRPSAIEAALAIQWAVRSRASIINMSFSVNRTAEMDRAIERAWSKGVFLCAAAGNYNARSRSTTVAYPASHPLVIAVGAIDRQGKRKSVKSPVRNDWGSRYGRGLDVVASGINVPTLNKRDAFGYVPGELLSDNDGNIGCLSTDKRTSSARASVVSKHNKLEFETGN